MAALSKDEKIIKYFIEDLKLDKDPVDENGLNALHFACCGGNLEIVKYLVEVHKFDINLPDNDGNPPIFKAIENGWLPVVKYLLALPNIDRTITSNKGSNMLHKASFNGKSDIVKYLIEVEKMDINTRDNSECTIFMNACCSDDADKELLQYLYDLNPDFLKGGNISGFSPLMFACAGGNLNAVKFLIEDCHLDIRKDNPNKYGVGPVEIAATKGRINILKYFFDKRIVKKNFRGTTGYTLLQCACSLGIMQSVKWLVEEAKVNVNQIANGDTALDTAFFKEYDEVINYLRSKGAKRERELNSDGFD